jgi:hypothetical protein
MSHLEVDRTHDAVAEFFMNQFLERGAVHLLHKSGRSADRSVPRSAASLFTAQPSAFFFIGQIEKPATMSVALASVSGHDTLRSPIPC